MLERIQRWWRFEGKYYHKDISNGIKNLIHWFPTIWKDRDYDQHYIYEVLLVKLEKQAKYILEKGIHVDANRDVERMLLCARLCRIQQKDLYHSEYMDYFKKEYEFVPTDETEKWFSMEDTLVWENYDEYLAKYPRQHKRVLLGEINRFNKPIEQKDKQEIAMEIALENQNRSLKLLFKILDQQINRWWN
jgi:hypothetical protein